MALSIAESERLFTQGEFARIIDGFSSREQRIGDKLPLEQRVILAHALVSAGRLSEAEWLCKPDGKPSSLLVLSRAESVLGIAAWRQAQIPKAVQHFERAHQHAQDARDHVAIAWAHLHRFRLAIDSEPLDSVMALLPVVRHDVTRAGDARVTAYLHCCVSVFEGQLGRLDESRRHCAIAESLLDSYPNHWIAANLLLNRANIACLSCDFGNAIQLTKLARRALTINGNHRLTISLENVVGYVELITGHFERAHERFSRLVNESNVHRFGMFPQVLNLARACFALNRLAECEAALSTLNFEAGEYWAPAYNVRWGGLTRAHVLRRNGDFEGARVWLNRLRALPNTRGDVAFVGALELALAQICACQADYAASARHLLNANSANVTEQREHVGVSYFTASTAVKGTLSSHLRSRALRVWGHQGVVYPFLELERPTPSIDAAKQQLGTACTAAPVPAALDCLVNAIAAGFALAHHPRLLGAELLSIVRALDCSPGARLIESHRSHEATPEIATLPLGTQGGKTVTLVCPAPAEPAAAVLLGDVLRIGRAALALEQARQDERNRAALWPASPVEEQAGALFLADSMQTLLGVVRRVAPTNVPILITGETGTGKEVVARTIHGYSPRAGRTFVPFNCTATPRDMLDAQLFGHRRGAFTGATDHAPGIIRGAAGGTLFLDEIGETSLDIQPKLLRFLDAGEVHPIGDTQPVRVDVRVIAATNADIEGLVATGRFREDLFYRLNIVRLHVPPLRERRVEIPALANHYLHKYATENGKQDLRLAEETMEYLVLYRWPGNVRQLGSEMRRMAVLSDSGAVLMPEHLSPEITASRRTIPASERALEPTELVVRIDQPMDAATHHLQRTMIQYALERCDNRVEETAALLGLSRKGLYLKRQRFGLLTTTDDVDVA